MCVVFIHDCYVFGGGCWISEGLGGGVPEEKGKGSCLWREP